MAELPKGLAGVLAKVVMIRPVTAQKNASVHRRWSTYCNNNNNAVFKLNSPVCSNCTVKVALMWRPRLRHQKGRI